MKKLYLFAALFLGFIGMSLTESMNLPGSGDSCGVISIGNYKLDLSHGELVIEVPKENLVESIKSGLSFAGTSKCPGAYEIVAMELTIDAERDATYQYDHAFVIQMQSMETYMLVRYFNDAEKLNFNNIQVKNSAGEIIAIPDLSVIVK